MSFSPSAWAFLPSSVCFFGLAESEGDTLAFPCSPELSPFSLKANTRLAARSTCITGIACRLITGAMTPSPSITVL